MRIVLAGLVLVIGALGIFIDSRAIEIPAWILVVVGVSAFLVGLLCGRLSVGFRRPGCEHQWSEHTAEVELSGKYDGCAGVIVLRKCGRCGEKGAELHHTHGVKEIPPLLAETVIKQREGKSR